MIDKHNNVLCIVADPISNTLITPIVTLRINTVSTLVTYLDSWNALSSDRPMQSSRWLISWWDKYAEADDELCILLFLGPENILIGVAPLYIQHKSTNATIRFLGSGGDFTHHTIWLSMAGWEDRIGIEVAHFLVQIKSEWKRLLFEGVDEDAASIHVTTKHLSKHGFLCHKRQIQSVWSIVLPETWEDYLRMLSSSLRKRCRKLQREYFDSGRIILRQVENETDLKEGLDVLLKLHRARWGSVEKPIGVFSDKRFLEFHKAYSKELLTQKQLRMAWLECDKVPLAIEYQFFNKKTLYAYQAGIDLAKDSYSAGKLTMMAAIQFSISNGCKSFDFLSGNDPYKMNWRATPTHCYDLRVWQPKIKGVIEWSKWHCYTLISQLLKRIIPQHHIIQGLKLIRAIKK